MKNILIAMVIVLAAIGACNPPQKSTDNTSDSTATNKSMRDTTMSTRDTTMSTRDTTMSRRDTTHRDTSMHR